MKQSSAALLFVCVGCFASLSPLSAQQSPSQNGATIDPDRIRALEERVRRLEQLLGREAGQEGAPSQSGAATVTHRIDHGETLASIAGRYGVSVEAVAQANGISIYDPIYVGDELVIPGAQKPSQGAGGSQMPVSGTYRPPGPQGQGGEPGYWQGSYRIRSGDTISAIARRFGVTPGEIIRVNGISDPDRIQVGQVIRVPDTGPSPAGDDGWAAQPSQPSAPSGTPPSSTPPEPDPLAAMDDDETYHYYEVLPGDTVSSIARIFFTTEEILYRLNDDLDPSGTIYAGQKIIVPTKRYFEELDRREQETVG